MRDRGLASLRRLLNQQTFDLLQLRVVQSDLLVALLHGLLQILQAAIHGFAVFFTLAVHGFAIVFTLFQKHSFQVFELFSLSLLELKLQGPQLNCPCSRARPPRAKCTPQAYHSSLDGFQDPKDYRQGEDNK